MKRAILGLIITAAGVGLVNPNLAEAGEFDPAPAAHITKACGQEGTHQANFDITLNNTGGSAAYFTSQLIRDGIVVETRLNTVEIFTYAQVRFDVLDDVVYTVVVTEPHLDPTVTETAAIDCADETVAFKLTCAAAVPHIGFDVISNDPNPHDYILESTAATSVPYANRLGTFSDTQIVPDHTPVTVTMTMKDRMSGIYEIIGAPFSVTPDCQAPPTTTPETTPESTPETTPETTVPPVITIPTPVTIPSVLVDSPNPILTTELPETGTDNVPTSLLAAGLTTMGALLVGLARRRASVRFADR